MLFVLVRNFYGIELPRTAVIGRRLRIGHQHGICLSRSCVIGDDCYIRQGVAIGSRPERQSGRESPVVGNRVSIGPGAVLAGPITVGDDVTIGPNAVVIEDVPSGSTVVSTPTRILRLRGVDAGPVPAAGEDRRASDAGI